MAFSLPGRYLSTVVDNLEVLDVAFVEQYLSDGLLHLRSGYINGLVLCCAGIADASQHIGRRIGDLHGFILLI